MADASVWSTITAGPAVAVGPEAGLAVAQGLDPEATLVVDQTPGRDPDHADQGLITNQDQGPGHATDPTQEDVLTLAPSQDLGQKVVPGQGHAQDLQREMVAPSLGHPKGIPDHLRKMHIPDLDLLIEMIGPDHDLGNATDQGQPLQLKTSILTESKESTVGPSQDQGPDLTAILLLRGGGQDLPLAPDLVLTLQNKTEKRMDAETGTMMKMMTTTMTGVK